MLGRDAAEPGNRGNQPESPWLSHRRMLRNLDLLSHIWTYFQKVHHLQTLNSNACVNTCCEEFHITEEWEAVEILPLSSQGQKSPLSIRTYTPIIHLPSRAIVSREGSIERCSLKTSKTLLTIRTISGLFRSLESMSLRDRKTRLWAVLIQEYYPKQEGANNASEELLDSQCHRNTQPRTKDKNFSFPCAKNSQATHFFRGIVDWPWDSQGSRYLSDSGNWRNTSSALLSHTWGSTKVGIEDQSKTLDLVLNQHLPSNSAAG